MKSELREKVLLMRKRDRLSYGEIKKRVPVSKSTLSQWRKPFPLSKEEILKLRRAGWTKGEASREKYRETMRLRREDKRLLVYNKQKKYFSSTTQRERFIAGLMLYLAEGSKGDPYKIVMTNTDSKLLRFHIGWLKEFFSIKREDLKAELHLYKNMDISAERKYWQKELGFKPEQFYKDQVRAVHKNTYSYSEGFRHGTCQVFYGGGEKKMLLMESIRAFIYSCYL